MIYQSNNLHPKLYSHKLSVIPSDSFKLSHDKRLKQKAASVLARKSESLILVGTDVYHTVLILQCLRLFSSTPCTIRAVSIVCCSPMHSLVFKLEAGMACLSNPCSTPVSTYITAFACCMISELFATKRRSPRCSSSCNGRCGSSNCGLLENMSQLGL